MFSFTDTAYLLAAYDGDLLVLEVYDDCVVFQVFGKEPATNTQWKETLNRAELESRLARTRPSARTVAKLPNPVQVQAELTYHGMPEVSPDQVNLSQYREMLRSLQGELTREDLGL